MRKKKIKNANFFVEPDEIFLDSKNLQNFDRQQFEGRIEKPIPKKTILFLGIFFVLGGIIFISRLGYLEIKKGQAYFDRSENNTLEKGLIFADRGIIYDRNKVELAWNKKTDGSPADLGQSPEGVPLREYLTPGFAHVLGYVSYPAADSSGIYWQTDFVGKDGLEKEYDKLLKGTNGLKIVETDAGGQIHSENTVDAPKRGQDLVTTIDSRVQKELFELIKNLADSNSFTGGAGVMMDVRNGEMIASTSFPEYDPGILSLGQDKQIINRYLNDKRKVFLDRTLSGLYTPGSIIKPIVALGALAENVIDPYKKILSTGSISIPNPYNPDQESIFKDWRAQGWVDMRQALAVSSDVYFYEVGGGYQDQKGLGIAGIDKYANMFGIDSKTGVDLPDEKSGTIPNPDWKAKNFPDDPTWRIGDTYHTAIGQYGFQATPLEMVRAIGAIANGGTLETPHFILGDSAKTPETSKINIDPADFAVVHDGMRQSVTEGTSVALNVPYIDVAAKTGTAQLGVAKNRVNSWVVGFFPYENPEYAFAIVMESGPSSGTVSASSIGRQLLDWMSLNTPEYFK
ncbi:MAG TPA: penicillin-binding transpeptidase domain-containing protein [Candidatus Paceibacterota bacterium]|nr:penicillin-binding transpeptidase domain-containing protein [Candidatus Paceibacterota bacterium]